MPLRTVLAVGEPTLEAWLGRQEALEVAGVAAGAARAGELIETAAAEAVVVARATAFGGLQDAAGLLAWLRGRNWAGRLVGLSGEDDPIGRAFAAQVQALGGTVLAGRAVAADVLRALQGEAGPRLRPAWWHVVGAGRGVGTSTVAVQLAVALAAFGRVVLVDGSDSGDATALLGAQKAPNWDDLDAGGRVADAAVAAQGIWCLRARPLGHAAAVLRQAAEEFDYALVDGPRGGEGSATLLVTDQDPRRTWPGRPAGVVVTRCRDGAEAARAVAARFGAPLWGAIPESAGGAAGDWDELAARAAGARKTAPDKQDSPRGSRI